MKNKTFSKCNLVLMYAFNYEYDFIEKAFPKSHNNTLHLFKKFDEFCNESDDNTLGFMRFYASLSERNKMTLVDYILNKSDFMTNEFGMYRDVESKELKGILAPRKPIREFGFEGL